DLTKQEETKAKQGGEEIKSAIAKAWYHSRVLRWVLGGFLLILVAFTKSALEQHNVKTLEIKSKAVIEREIYRRVYGIDTITSNITKDELLKVHRKVLTTLYGSEYPNLPLIKSPLLYYLKGSMVSSIDGGIISLDTKVTLLAKVYIDLYTGNTTNPTRTELNRQVLELLFKEELKSYYPLLDKFNHNKRSKTELSKRALVRDIFMWVRKTMAEYVIGKPVKQIEERISVGPKEERIYLDNRLLGDTFSKEPVDFSSSDKQIDILINVPEDFVINQSQSRWVQLFVEDNSAHIQKGRKVYIRQAKEIEPKTKKETDKWYRVSIVPANGTGSIFFTGERGEGFDANGVAKVGIIFGNPSGSNKRFNGNVKLGIEKVGIEKERLINPAIKLGVLEETVKSISVSDLLKEERRLIERSGRFPEPLVIQERELMRKATRGDWQARLEQSRQAKAKAIEQARQLVASRKAKEKIDASVTDSSSSPLKINNFYKGAIYSFYLREHSTRDRAIAVLIAKELGLPRKLIKILEQTALLHDLGGLNADICNYRQVIADLKRRLAEYNIASGQSYESFKKQVIESKIFTEEEIGLLLNELYQTEYTLDIIAQRNIKLPYEIEILIRYHHDYQGFLRFLETLDESRLSITKNDLKLLMNIFISADSFEGVVNAYKRKIFHNTTAMPLDTAIGAMNRRFLEGYMSDERPLVALKRLIARREKRLLNIIFEARGQKGLSREELQFVNGPKDNIFISAAANLEQIDFRGFQIKYHTDRGTKSIKDVRIMESSGRVFLEITNGIRNMHIRQHSLFDNVVLLDIDLVNGYKLVIAFHPLADQRSYFMRTRLDDKDGRPLNSMDFISKVEGQFNMDGSLHINLIDRLNNTITLGNDGLESIRQAGGTIKYFSRLTTKDFSATLPARLANSRGEVIKEYVYDEDNSLSEVKGISIFYGNRTAIQKVTDIIITLESPTKMIAFGGRTASGKSTFITTIVEVLNRTNVGPIIVIPASRFILDEHAREDPGLGLLFFDQFRVDMVEQIRELKRGNSVYLPIFDTVLRRWLVYPKDKLQERIRSQEIPIVIKDKKLLPLARNDTCLIGKANQIYGRDILSDNLFVDVNTGRVIERIAVDRGTIILDGAIYLIQPELAQLSNLRIFFEASFPMRLLRNAFRAKTTGRPFSINRVLQARIAFQHYFDYSLSEADIVINNNRTARQDFIEFLKTLPATSENELLLRARQAALKHIPYGYTSSPVVTPLGNITIIVGMQIGDEGKGKISHYYGQIADIAVRAQGGNNAGHSIIINGQEYTCRSIPSGAFNLTQVCVIGNGVIIDPKQLVEELEKLRQLGFTLSPERLKVSELAHITLPYHLRLIKFKGFRERPIGGAGRGVGPTLVDKAMRIGIRMRDFVNPEAFREKLKDNLAKKNKEYVALYGNEGFEPLDFDTIYAEYSRYADILRPYVTDTVVYLYKAIAEGKKIVIEGAQATGLDVDFGAYPYITATSTTAGGLCFGSGIAPTKVDKVVGVLGVYNIKIREGPHPTRIVDEELASHIRRKGNEFNKVNPEIMRYIGWMDIPLARLSVIVNGITEVSLTKLDVFDALETIKICTAYKYKGKVYEIYTSDLDVLYNGEPIYEELPGWQKDTTGVKSFEELPENAKRFIYRIEELLGIKISSVSVGPGTGQILEINSASSSLFDIGTISKALSTLGISYDPLKGNTLEGLTEIIWGTGRKNSDTVLTKSEFCQHIEKLMGVTDILEAMRSPKKMLAEHRELVISEHRELVIRLLARVATGLASEYQKPLEEISQQEFNRLFGRVQVTTFGGLGSRDSPFGIEQKTVQFSGKEESILRIVVNSSHNTPGIPVVLTCGKAAVRKIVKSEYIEKVKDLSSTSEGGIIPEDWIDPEIQAKFLPKNVILWTGSMPGYGGMVTGAIDAILNKTKLMDKASYVQVILGELATLADPEKSNSNFIAYITAVANDYSVTMGLRKDNVVTEKGCAVYDAQGQFIALTDWRKMHIFYTDDAPRKIILLNLLKQDDPLNASLLEKLHNWDSLEKTPSDKIEEKGVKRADGSLYPRDQLARDIEELPAKQKNMVLINANTAVFRKDILHPISEFVQKVRAKDSEFLKQYVTLNDKTKDPEYAPWDMVAYIGGKLENKKELAPVDCGDAPSSLKRMKDQNLFVITWKNLLSGTLEKTLGGKGVDLSQLKDFTLYLGSDADFNFHNPDQLSKLFGKNVTLKGRVHLDSRSRIEDNAIIEDSYIKGNSIIREGVKVINSIIEDSDITEDIQAKLIRNNTEITNQTPLTSQKKHIEAKLDISADMAYVSTKIAEEEVPAATVIDQTERIFEFAISDKKLKTKGQPIIDKTRVQFYASHLTDTELVMMFGKDAPYGSKERWIDQSQLEGTITAYSKYTHIGNGTYVKAVIYKGANYQGDGWGIEAAELENTILSDHTLYSGVLQKEADKYTMDVYYVAPYGGYINSLTILRVKKVKMAYIGAGAGFYSERENGSKVLDIEVITYTIIPEGREIAKQGNLSGLMKEEIDLTEELNKARTDADKIKEILNRVFKDESLLLAGRFTSLATALLVLEARQIEIAAIVEELSERKNAIIERMNILRHIAKEALKGDNAASSAASPVTLREKLKAFVSKQLVYDEQLEYLPLTQTKDFFEDLAREYPEHTTKMHLLMEFRGEEDRVFSYDVPDTNFISENSAEAEYIRRYLIRMLNLLIVSRHADVIRVSIDGSQIANEKLVRWLREEIFSPTKKAKGEFGAVISLTNRIFKRKHDFFVEATAEQMKEALEKEATLQPRPGDTYYGISMGTSIAVGFVDRMVRITRYLLMLGQAYISMTTKDRESAHNFTKILGAAQKYLSQQGVFRLAKRGYWQNRYIDKEAALVALMRIARRFNVNIPNNLSDINEMIESVRSQIKAEQLLEEFNELFTFAPEEKEKHNKLHDDEKLKYIISFFKSPEDRFKEWFPQGIPSQLDSLYKSSQETVKADQVQVNEILKEIGLALAELVELLHKMLDRNGTNQVVVFGRAAHPVAIETARARLKEEERVKRHPDLDNIQIRLASEIADEEATKLGQAQGAVWYASQKLIMSQGRSGNDISAITGVKGIKIAIDAGGMDIKGVAFKDGIKVFQKEQRWRVATFKTAFDPKEEKESHLGYVYAMIKLGIIAALLEDRTDTIAQELKARLEAILPPTTPFSSIKSFIQDAKKELGQLDHQKGLVAVIGISWPDIIIIDPTTGKATIQPTSDKTRNLPQEDKDKYIIPLEDVVSEEFGGAVTAVASDGNISAFWAAVEILKKEKGKQSSSPNANTFQAISEATKFEDITSKSKVTFIFKAGRYGQMRYEISIPGEESLSPVTRERITALLTALIYQRITIFNPPSITIYANENIKAIVNEAAQRIIKDHGNLDKGIMEGYGEIIDITERINKQKFEIEVKDIAELQAIPEEVDIFDKDGRYLGKMPRSNVYQDNIWHREIHILAVTPEAKVIRSKRSRRGKPHDNKFDISVAGTVKSEEDFKEAAIREIKEEFGLTIDTKRLISVGEEGKYRKIGHPMIEKDQHEGKYLFRYHRDQSTNEFSAFYLVFLTRKEIIQAKEYVTSLPESEFEYIEEVPLGEFARDCANPAEYGSGVRQYLTSNEIVREIDEKIKTQVEQPATIDTTKVQKRLTSSEEFQGPVVGIDIGGSGMKILIQKDNGAEGVLLRWRQRWGKSDAQDGFGELTKYPQVLLPLIRFTLALASLAGNNLTDNLQDKVRFLADETAVKTITNAELANRLEDAALDLEAKLAQRKIKVIVPVAIGISFPDVVVNNEIVGGITSKTKPTIKEIAKEGSLDRYWLTFEEKIHQLPNLIRASLNRPNLPIAIANDGVPGAILAAAKLKRGGILAVSYGTSPALGYIDEDGELPGTMFYMGHFPIDLNPQAPVHTSTKIAGGIQQYLSEKAVSRLAEQELDEGFIQKIKSEVKADDKWEKKEAGITKALTTWYEEDSALDNPRLTSREREAIERIFKQIGVYLGEAIIQIQNSLGGRKINTVVLFGAVTKRKVIDITINTAEEYLKNRGITSIDIKLAKDIGIKVSDDPKEADEAAVFGQAQGAVYMANQFLKEVGQSNQSSSAVKQNQNFRDIHGITAQSQFEAPNKYDFAKLFVQEFRYLGEDIQSICQYLKDSGKITGPPEGFDASTFALAYQKEGKMYWAENLTEKDIREAIQALTHQNRLHFDEETIITHIQAHELRSTGKEAIIAQVKKFTEALADSFLKYYKETKEIQWKSIEIIIRIALSDEEEVSKIGTEALLDNICSYLYDFHSLPERMAYYKILVQALQALRKTSRGARLDERLSDYGLKTEEDVLKRMERVREWSAIRQDKLRIRKVFIFSRGPIGGDMNITSILIQKAKEEFLNAQIILVGSSKVLWQLFGAIEGVRFVECAWKKDESFIEQIGRALGAYDVIRKEGFEESDSIIIDPSSHLLKHGLIPVRREDNYYYFDMTVPEEDYKGSLAQRADEWSDEVLRNGKPRRITYGITQPPQPYAKKAEDLYQNLKLTGKYVVTIQFGVGGDETKSLSEDFETELIAQIVDKWSMVILSKGIGAEANRVDRIKKTLEQRGYKTIEVKENEIEVSNLAQKAAEEPKIIIHNGDLGTFAEIVRRSNLFIGYDSMGQHLAATSRVPEITVFAGYVSPKFPQFWRPYTSSMTEQVIVGPRGSVINENKVLDEVISRYKDIAVAYVFDYDKTLEEPGRILKDEHVKRLTDSIVIQNRKVIIVSAKSLDEIPGALKEKDIPELRKRGKTAEAKELEGVIDNKQGLMRFVAQQIAKAVYAKVGNDLTKANQFLNNFILYLDKSATRYTIRLEPLEGGYRVIVEVDIEYSKDKRISKDSKETIVSRVKEIYLREISNIEKMVQEDINAGDLKEVSNLEELLIKLSPEPKLSIHPVRDEDEVYYSKILYHFAFDWKEEVRKRLGKSEDYHLDAKKYREYLIGKIREGFKKREAVGKVVVEGGGAIAIDITPVGKEEAIKDIYARGYRAIKYYGDDPEGSDKAVFELAEKVKRKEELPDLELEVILVKGPQDTYGYLDKELANNKAIQWYRQNPIPLVIRCEVMHYPWGGKEFIPALLRIDNSEGKPYAELWIGAHPKASAKANVIDIEINLAALIKAVAEEILGKQVAKQFNATLPYLLKVLVAQEALSIQAHPNKAQAEEGFRQENALGIGLNADNRNYKDDNHKPEIICALSKFWALNGFRPIEEIISSFVEVDIPQLREEFNAFKESVEKAGKDNQLRRQALRDFYSVLMKRVEILKRAQAKKEESEIDRAQGEITPIVSYVVTAAKKRIAESLGLQSSDNLQEIIQMVEKRGKIDALKRELWALKLNELYANDMGILSVYLLNLVQLEPGEAMYLPAGELHAYLGKLNPQAKDEGAGMELMANSDNVLRGGLTPKHVDVPELLKILSFNSSQLKILTPIEVSVTEKVYKTEAGEFELSVIEINESQTHTNTAYHSIEALIVLEGRVVVVDSKGNRLELERGQTFLMPAISGAYTIQAIGGLAKLYKASLPQLAKTNTPEDGTAGTIQIVRNPTVSSPLQKPIFLKKIPNVLDFGTSGLRGKVVDMTDRECYIYTRGFIEYLIATRQIQRGDIIFIAGDLRSSTERIMAAVAKAIKDSNCVVDNCGNIPTPALAYYGWVIKKGRASIMITGSHIPEDQNGIKFNKPSGELLKADEDIIRTYIGIVREEEDSKTEDETIFDEDAMFKEQVSLGPVNPEARESYIKRYLDIFSRDSLKGKRIVVYQQSAVGRDIIVEILEGLGAEVIPVERSDKFTAVDTEVIPEWLQKKADKWISEYKPDDIVYLDGDSDRPGVFFPRAKGKAEFIWGDTLGILATKFLNPDFAAVTISSNEQIDYVLKDRLTLAKTRIGSPYVVKAMIDAQRKGYQRVVSWEGNGGFLTQTDFEINGQTLKPLPTRDSILPILSAILLTIRENKSMSQIIDELPPRYKWADRVKFPIDDMKEFKKVSGKMLEELSREDNNILEVRFNEQTQEVEVIYINENDQDVQTGRERKETFSYEDSRVNDILLKKQRLENKYLTPSLGFEGGIVSINYLDGVRITFKNNDIVHFRPSGNAPEFRCYGNAETKERAIEIVKIGLENIIPKVRDKLRRQYLSTGLLYLKPFDESIPPPVEWKPWGWLVDKVERFLGEKAIVREPKEERIYLDNRLLGDTFSK
ncbi:MAG: adenylosuccinate synthase, partial [Candidatus Desantisbacteria bacterium]